MRALVLSGGGSKGAYQAGAVQYLMGEMGIDYDMVCGTSVGAINAAFIAQYRLGAPRAVAAALKQMWRRVSTDKVRKRWFPFGVISSLWKSSVYDSTPLQQWVRSELNDERIRTSGRQLRMMTVSLGTSEIRTVTENDQNLPDWVLASAAFPVMLQPIRVEGDLWTDGGVRRVTPLSAAVAAGATDIDVILCSDPYAKDDADTNHMHAVPQILLRAIDIMNDQISRSDLELCALKNDLSCAPGSRWHRVNLRVMKPQSPLTQDSLDFSPTSIERMMTIGYADALHIGAYEHP
jgi:predicted acylesterase/phospholipase RssA